MIDYDDSTHTYSFRGRRYLSATQVIDHFKNHFRSREQAVEYTKKAGRTPEYWMEQWEEKRDIALSRGHRIHNLREMIVRNQSMSVALGQPFRVQNVNLYYNESLSQLPDGIYPEQMVWHHGWGIAGRIDKLIIQTIDGIRYSHVQDYKTNKFIATRSWMQANGNRVTMLTPLNHIEDCAMSHYQLQLSEYQFMLKSHGFTPGRCWITHFGQVPAIAPLGAAEPPPKDYVCGYWEDAVTSMLTELKRQRIL